MNWLAGPALAQPTSVTQIGAERSPLSSMIWRAERTAAATPASSFAYGWIASVSNALRAPAAYMPLRNSANGMPRRLCGIPAETISAVGSLRLIAEPTTLRRRV